MVEVKWMGTFTRYPLIFFTVTDGVNKATMVASDRTKKGLSKFFAKSAPYRSGRMNMGCRFRLVDYTTRMFRGEPRIYVEKVKT